jgi:hypothetical protein
VIRASVLMLIAGCDLVYQLDRTPRAAPLINDGAGDEDGDGVPNSMDICPTIHSDEIGADTDDDGDGVGNACDPRPGTPDCLALFDDFASLSPHWQFEGAPITFQSDAQGSQVHFDGGPESIMFLDVPLDLRSLSIGGYLPGSASQHRAVQIFLDHVLGRGISGTACGIDQADESAPTQVVNVEVTDGEDAILAAAPAGSYPVGAGPTFALAWNIDDRDTCQSFMSVENVPMDAKVDAPAGTGNRIAIRTLNAGLDLRVVVGYGRICDDD